MKKPLLGIILSLAGLLVGLTQAHATHTMGVDMTYECLGPGQYRIILQVYRDCNGIAMVNNHDIYYSSVQCGVSGSINVHQVSVEDITPVCQQSGNTACNGSGQYGVEKYTFLGILTLPVGCGNDWELSWELCCRNGAITNLLDPLNETVYIKICLDNTLSPCNNSPFFLNNPIPFYCLNQPVFYNHGVIDVDGDSLVFTAGTSLSNGGVSVAYQPGYSGSAPFNTSTGDPYNVDPVTGDITYTPDALQIAVAAIHVDEYRNGVHIGCVVRDMQFTILNCNNLLPEVSGINGTDTFNITISTCSDTCFQIFTNDGDPADNLTLDWNNGIPSASFTTTNAQHPTGLFCWAPTDLDIGLHYFTVTVKDDHCPIIGTAMRSFIVRVVPSLDPPVNAGRDTILCYGSTINLNATVSGGTPTGYTWNDGTNTWNTQNITVNPVTTTSYAVTANYADGCRKTDNVIITVSDPLIAFAAPTVVLCYPGSVTLSTTTNALNPTYQWSPNTGFSCTNCPNPTVTPSGASQYCVSLTDFYNCPSNTACVQVLTNTRINPSIMNLDSVSCFGGNNGLIQLSATGGTPPYQYSVDGVNFQASPVFNNLTAGNYTVVIRDAYLCDTVLTASIYQPTVFTASITNSQNITCFGGNNGSVQLGANGGTPPYQYSLNGAIFQPSPSFTGLIANNYTATIRDAELCTVTLPFSITQPAQVTVVVANAVSPGCFGGNDGSVQLAGSGGTAPYQYSLDGVTFQSSGNFNSLIANGYTATVRDANSCTTIIQFTISQPPLVLLTLVNSTNAGCTGANDGTAQLSVTGGTGPYSYSLDGFTFQSSGSFSSLASGTYNATGRDASGCVSSLPFIINQSPPMVLSVAGTDTNSCYNGSDGAVQLAMNGGSSPYQYSLDGVNFQLQSSFNNLAAGSYTAIVRDVNSCTATVPFNIYQPAPVAVNVTNNVGVQCFGGANGSATISITGGTAPYVARLGALTVSSTPYTFSQLPANTYIINVTDANNCSASISVTINQPAQLGLSLSSMTPANCYGGNDGTVVLNTSGGVSPYQYSLDGSLPGLNSSFTGLTPGPHTALVIDANQCSRTLQVNVAQPAQTTFVNATVTNPGCLGSANGAIDLTLTGTGGPWSYFWSNGFTTQDISGLNAGYYFVTVYDVNNCETPLDSIFVSEPSLLNVTTNVRSVSCYGLSDGLITAIVSGGTNPYSFTWSNGITGNPAQPLSPGTYAVTITDANNCTATAQNIAVMEPDQLTLTTSTNDVSCPGYNDGSILSNVAGGTAPYNYSWSNNPGNVATNIGLAPGYYACTATDANNCSATADNVIIELIGVDISARVRNVLCDPLQNGLIDISVQTQFPPARYQWSNGENTEDVYNLPAGYYSVTVTDANNCTADTSLVVLNDNSFSIAVSPTYSHIVMGDSVHLVTVGIGGRIASIAWNPPIYLDCSTCPATVAFPPSSMQYEAIAISDSGCVANDYSNIVVDGEHVIFIPNVFTPDGGRNNDFFEVFGNKESWLDFHVLVFDRLGEKMYESYDKYFKWDGTYKGEFCAPQVFVYVIKLSFIDGYYDGIRKGSVTLLR